MKTLSTSRKSRAILLLWLVESALIAAAVVAAARLRFMNSPGSYADFLQAWFLHVVPIPVIVTVSMAAFGLYQIHLRYNRMDFMLRLLMSFGFGGMALLALYYVVPQTYVGRAILAMAMAMAFVGVIILRFVWLRLFRADLFKRRVLVLGAGRNADIINQRLRRSSDRHAFVLVGFLPAPGQVAVVPEHMLLTSSGGLPELTRSLQVDEIVVALDERRGGLPMEEMLACAQRGVIVTDLSTFFERESGVVKLDVADPSWLVFSGGFDHSVTRRLSKRFFDLAVATMLLLIGWPIMLLVAFCIWCESGLPILYRQTRVGANGQCFEILKFRSMRVDAEKDGVAVWCVQDDDRRTKVGEFIRTTHLDELPQLFNVLRGQMSFVGPRPERPQFVDMLSKEVRYYDVRHSIKPGLTGLAQVRCLYGASVQDHEHRLTFDLFYVKNHSLMFDLMILLQTVEAVLFRRGSR